MPRVRFTLPQVRIFPDTRLAACTYCGFFARTDTDRSQSTSVTSTSARETVSLGYGSIHKLPLPPGGWLTSEYLYVALLTTKRERRDSVGCLPPQYRRGDRLSYRT